MKGKICPRCAEDREKSPWAERLFTPQEKVTALERALKTVNPKGSRRRGAPLIAL
jgi:hypothetical protein